MDWTPTRHEDLDLTEASWSWSRPATSLSRGLERRLGLEADGADRGELAEWSACGQDHSPTIW